MIELILCKDCKHLLGDYICVSPENGVSLIDGKPKPLLAGVSRSNSSFFSHCGQDAKYFEKKPTVGWRRFLLKYD